MTIDKLRIFLAAVIATCFVAVVILVALGIAKVDSNSLAIGALISITGTVYNFAFGSSSGSERKTDLLAQSVPAPQPPPAPVAPAQPGETK